MTSPLSRVPAVLADTFRTRGRGLKNAFATGGRGRMIVFDSDDWGSQRVPSRRALVDLVSAGVLTGKGDYDRDTLEDATDLALLADVLASARGGDGRPAVFSCYCNPANPDFAAIRENGFSQYVWEGLSATLTRRGDAAQVRAAWAQARSEGLFLPQFHGREHLQTAHWMAALRGSEKVKAGFDLGFYSVALPGVPPWTRAFRAANFFDDPAELGELAETIRSGADCFAAEFGVRAEIYCPTNNIFHPDLYPAVREAGCRAIIRHVRNVEPDGRGGVRTVWGQAGVDKAGLAWFGRNAVFEPGQGLGVDHALAGIASAFAWGVPAVISTHRANYVGGIDPAVREAGLRQLRSLLSEISRRWPDACFAPSTALLDDAVLAA